MRIFLSTVVAGVVGCSSLCIAEARMSPIPRILDGRKSRISWAPVAQVGQCTGTLLTPTTVVTAAHCWLDTLSAGVVQIGGETIAISEARTAVPFTNTALPSDGTPQDLPFPDVQLVTLTRPVTRALPAPILLSRPLRQGERVMLMGYGVTGPGARDNGTLRLGFTRIRRVTSRYAYSVKRPGTTGTCGGDSGGPVFARVVRGGKRVWALAGIISYSLVEDAAPDCGDGQEDVFVVVRHPTVRRFLLPRVEHRFNLGRRLTG